MANPRWAIVLSLGLSVGVTALQLVFPQESEHRFGWWKNRWAHRYRRRYSNPLPLITRQITPCRPPHLVCCSGDNSTVRNSLCYEGAPHLPRTCFVAKAAEEGFA